jgi:DNA-binding LacI/PurR family transcriptional regulator
MSAGRTGGDRTGGDRIGHMKLKSVTIKEVAQRAGVSIATVSRVVNGNYYVGPEMKQRVNEAITALDYQPNFFARSLKGASSLTIAILVSDISNSYFNLVAKAIENVVWLHDYHLIFGSTEGSAERELATLNNLVNKKIDGLILNTTGHNDRYVAQASKTLPVVLLHRRLNARGFKGDFVDSDNHFGAAVLTRHLLESGHTRIGAINGQLDLSSGQERFAGFCESMAEAGTLVDAACPDVYNGDFTAQSGYDGMEYFHRERPGVTGVVVMNNAMTMGAMRYLREHRLRVPGDYSIVCYGDIVNRDLMYVRPTTVSLDPQTIGSRAADMLISRIEKPTSRRRQFIYEPLFNPGESVGSPARRLAIDPLPVRVAMRGA